MLYLLVWLKHLTNENELFKFNLRFAEAGLTGDTFPEAGLAGDTFPEAGLTGDAFPEAGLAAEAGLAEAGLLLLA